MNKLIAISGGIGSGKSIISHILQYMGYPVYDCDSNARRLIDNSTSIKQAICSSLGTECISAYGTLDREVVGRIVFNNPDKLQVLNSITHAAVKDDIRLWHQNQSARLSFVETAILYQSGIDKMVDAVIEITAPFDTKVQRIMHRNNIEYQDVVARINSQNYSVDTPHANVYTILNDDIHAVMPQLINILGKLV